MVATVAVDNLDSYIKLAARAVRDHGLWLNYAIKGSSTQPIAETSRVHVIND